jgi:hypothetical protein
MKTPAEKKKKNRSFSFATIVEMLFTLLMIPLGLSSVRALEATENMEEMLAALMMAECLLLSVTTFLRAAARRYRNQIPQRRIIDFIFAGLFLLSAAAVFVWPTMLVMSIAGVVFMLSLIPSRVFSILQNRKWFNIVLNAAFILVVLGSLWEIWSGVEDQVMFVVVVLLLAAFRSLLHTMSVTFARLRLDLLREIVQQTYAAEIIFGLLLLIASFSFVLRYTDRAAFGGEYTNALWYCFAVVTTIGFGDMTATSAIGRILTVILGVYGIIVVALITSIIVNFYGEMKKSRGAEEPAPEAVPESEPEAGGEATAE